MLAACHLGMHTILLPKLPFRTFAVRCLTHGSHSATLRNRPSEEKLNDSAQSADPGTQKRRSTRIVQAVPITVTGTDALGQPFKERTTTVMVNCHGCKYQSKHYVPKNSIVKLDIPRPEGGPFSTRVAWCGSSARARYASYSKSGLNSKLPVMFGELPSLLKTGLLPRANRLN